MCKKEVTRGTYRIPLPGQTIVIQRVWMEVSPIYLDKGRTVQIDRQCGPLGFLLV
jgi:hypothetical protein